MEIDGCPVAFALCLQYLVDCWVEVIYLLHFSFAGSGGHDGHEGML
jgi:hypothetical protein